MRSASIIRVHVWLPAVALVASVGLVFGGLGLQRSPRISTANPPVFNALVHWSRAGHDWLVVADGEADAVVIYNAADGRLLKRVQVSRGVRDAGGLVQRDGDVFVVGEDGTLDQLKLSPPLIAAADSR